MVVRARSCFSDKKAPIKHDDDDDKGEEEEQHPKKDPSIPIANDRFSLRYEL